VGAPEAKAIGLLDDHFGANVAAFVTRVRDEAAALAAAGDLPQRLAAKNARRAADEAAKPLDRYREEELAHMKLNFYGFDPSYHVARYHFVYRVCKSRTPFYLARHRG
jgi:putative two-component system hydrogenase maturation factor HypX/HoxX